MLSRRLAPHQARQGSRAWAANPALGKSLWIICACQEHRFVQSEAGVFFRKQRWIRRVIAPSPQDISPSLACSKPPFVWAAAGTTPCRICMLRSTTCRAPCLHVGASCSSRDEQRHRESACCWFTSPTKATENRKQDVRVNRSTSAVRLSRGASALLYRPAAITSLLLAFESTAACYYYRLRLILRLAHPCPLFARPAPLIGSTICPLCSFLASVPPLLTRSRLASASGKSHRKNAQAEKIEQHNLFAVPD